MHQLILKPRAKKELNKLSEQDYLRIIAAFNELVSNPHAGKKLQGKYKGEWSFRVWPFRIVYRIHKSELIVVVIRIAHRQGVYK